MRKLTLIVFVIACAAFVSCNSGGSMSVTAKKNLEVNSAIMKAYEAGDFAKVRELIAADAVDHGGEEGDVKGVDNIIKEMERYRSQMKDMKTNVIKEMADDEYVMTWAKFSGTLTADGMGKKAGDKLEMTSLDVSKFKDGKAVEHWVFVDPNEMMKMMMGNMPPMPMQPAHGDTNSVKPPAPSN